MSTVSLIVLLASISSLYGQLFTRSTNISRLTNASGFIRRQLLPITHLGTQHHIVKSHNDWRRKVARGVAYANTYDNDARKKTRLPGAKDMYQLQWNDALALSAGAYADFCSEDIHSDKWDGFTATQKKEYAEISRDWRWADNRENYAFNDANIKYGENMATYSLPIEMTDANAAEEAVTKVMAATDDWYSEIKFYPKFKPYTAMQYIPGTDPDKLRAFVATYGEHQVAQLRSNNPNDPQLTALEYGWQDIGHFEQVIWGPTQQIGCGYAICKQENAAPNHFSHWVQVVCQYDVAAFNLMNPYTAVSQNSEIASLCPARNEDEDLCVPTATAATAATATAATATSAIGGSIGVSRTRQGQPGRRSRPPQRPLPVRKAQSMYYGDDIQYDTFGEQKDDNAIGYVYEYDQYSNYKNAYALYQLLIFIALTVLFGCVLCILYCIAGAILFFIASKKEKENETSNTTLELECI